MLAIYLPKVGIKLYTMSFQILLLVSILFVTVINPYSVLKIVLDTMLILHFVVGTIMHGYNTVEPLYLWYNIGLLVPIIALALIIVRHKFYLVDTCSQQCLHNEAAIITDYSLKKCI